MKKYLIVIITAIVIALIIGSGMYLWHLTVLEKAEKAMQLQNNKLQQQISALKSQLDKETAEENESNQKGGKEPLYQEGSGTEPTEQSERYVRIISPNGGESVCLGGKFNIRWESKGVETVSLRLIGETMGTSVYYYIGMNSVPATYNDYGTPGEGFVPWEVKNVPEGQGYKIEIESADFGPKVKDESDKVFTILSCKG